MGGTPPVNDGPRPCGKNQSWMAPLKVSGGYRGTHAARENNLKENDASWMHS
jgi:hypothetical protein